jgi:hypothetical protein
LKEEGVKHCMDSPQKLRIMKAFYTILLITLATNFASAKTYTLGSGKWTDAKIWNNDYPGTTIKTNDIVIITGQVTMNTAIVVEGMLTVEKGAFMYGMKDLVISKSGKFVNNGNTVMKRIINEGTINNNLVMESINDVDNKGLIENNNNVVAGNNFENFGGNAKGNGGAYYVNNNVYTSPASNFGVQVKVFYGNEIENSKESVPSTPLLLNATFNSNNGVVLNISNPKKLNIVSYRIEKSQDGSNYTLLSILSDNNGTMNYTDNKIGSNLTYYRVKALSANGEEIILPIATAKTPPPAMPKDYSYAN